MRERIKGKVIGKGYVVHLGVSIIILCTYIPLANHHDDIHPWVLCTVLDHHTVGSLVAII